MVTFDLDTRKLSLYNNEDIFVELTKPASRLLIELIKNNRQNVSRDALMKSVWIDYGLVGSNAGLNNYISELRKAFISLEVSRDIIVTIPKFGFQLDADIQVIARRVDNHPTDDELKLSSSLILNDSEECNDKENEHSYTESIGNENRRKSLFVLMAKFNRIFVLVIFFVLFYFIFIRAVNDHAEVTFLYANNNCQISTLGLGKGTANMVGRAKQQVEKLNLDCINNSYDIFYDEELKGGGFRSRAFVAVCDRVDNNRYGSCRNYKLNQDAVNEKK